MSAVEYGYRLDGEDIYPGWTKATVVAYITGHAGYELISRVAA